MADIQFERGTFYRFRALEKIHLGQYRLDIMQGDLFDFDGWELVYGGQSFNAAPLKVKLGPKGWFVPFEDTSSTYEPQPAGVQVRPAETVGNERGAPVAMGSASAEEGVAGTVADSMERRIATQDSTVKQHIQPDHVRVVKTPTSPALQTPQTVAPPTHQPVVPQRRQAATPTGTVDGADSLSDEDRARVAAANAENARRIAAIATQPVKKSTVTSYSLQSDVDEAPRSAGPGGKYAVIAADGQEGVQVKTFGSAGGAAVGRTDEAIGQATGMDVTKVTTNQIEARLKPMGAPARTGAAVDTTPMPVAQAARHVSSTQIPAEGNEAIDAIMPNGGTGDVDEARSGENLADLLPNAEYAGRRTAAVADPLAEILDGWDMKRHWKHRVEEAVDFYAHDAAVLKAIFAVESPGVIKNISAALTAQGIDPPTS
mgnify:CR=1 FL=1